MLQSQNQLEDGFPVCGGIVRQVPGQPGHLLQGNFIVPAYKHEVPAKEEDGLNMSIS